MFFCDNVKARKTAFSIAEAMITLLIVSVALAAAAPIMSKNMNNVRSDGTPIGMVSFFNISCDRVDGNKWQNVPASWQGRYPRIVGTYDICDRNGENADGTCVNRLFENQEVLFGQFSGDAIRNITGETVSVAATTHSGAFMQLFDENGKRVARGNIGGGGYYPGDVPRFDASLVVPTANENLVKTVGLYMCVKVR